MMLMGMNKATIKKSQTRFISYYVQALLQGKAAAFVGAGCSIPCGFPSWENLLKEAAAELGLSDTKGVDLVSLAQYYKNEKNRRAVNKLLRDKIALHPLSPSADHKVLVSLPITTFWTTNYDALIETSLADAGKTSRICRTPQDLAGRTQHDETVVYKMHGDVENPSSMVLTREDYETYHANNEAFLTKLKADLIDNTFLFVGFSFEDPNINYVLGHLRVLLKGAKTRHFWIIKVEKQAAGQSDEDFRKKQKIVELKIKDLKRYGIYAVLINDYSEIEHLLRKVRNSYHCHNVFISGAAVNYAPYTQEQGKDFVLRLVYRLLDNYNRILTGFGTGVGDCVVNAVLSYAEEKKIRNIDSLLLVRPFPQKIADAAEQRALWRQNRERLLDAAGVAIFLWGNKYSADEPPKTLPSNGMDEEFEIALNKGVKLIPLSCTLNKAGEYYQRLSDDEAYLDYDLSRSEYNELKVLNQIPFDRVNEIVTGVENYIANLQRKIN